MQIPRLPEFTFPFFPADTHSAAYATDFGSNSYTERADATGRQASVDIPVQDGATRGVRAFMPLSVAVGAVANQYSMRVVSGGGAGHVTAHASVDPFTRRLTITANFSQSDTMATVRQRLENAGFATEYYGAASPTLRPDFSGVIDFSGGIDALDLFVRITVTGDVLIGFGDAAPSSDRTSVLLPEGVHYHRVPGGTKMWVKRRSGNNVAGSVETWISSRT